MTYLINVINIYQKLEMCPWDTDAPAVEQFAHSHKQKQKKTFL